MNAQTLEPTVGLSPNDLREKLSQLPDVPQHIHGYGALIEDCFWVLFLTNRHISDMKETADRMRKAYANSVRDGKATLSEKDKQEIARLCDDDADLKEVDQRIREYQEYAARWEARASRLRRDFDVARIEFERDAIRRR